MLSGFIWAFKVTERLLVVGRDEGMDQKLRVEG